MWSADPYCFDVNIYPTEDRGKLGANIICQENQRTKDARECSSVRRQTLDVRSRTTYSGASESLTFFRNKYQGRVAPCLPAVNPASCTTPPFSASALFALPRHLRRLTGAKPRSC